MATYYVRSTDGNDGDSGLTWALAKATLAGALAVAVAGDRIWVSQAHAETQATAMTLTSAGTAAAPVEILCGNDAAEPPTALATTATVTTTGTSNISFAGFAYFYGITFSAGTGAGASFLEAIATTPWYFIFEACALQIGGTSASGRISIGSTSGNVDDAGAKFVNCTAQFAAVGQAFNVMAPLQWFGGSLTLGTAPTGGLFKTLTGGSPIADIRGVDFSNLGANALVGIGTGAPGGRIAFLNCKLAASAPLTTGANPGPGQTVVFLDNCDSADTQSRMQRHSYEGDVYSETTIVRTGGASNGTTPLSHRMVSSASRVFVDPLYGPDLVIWNNLTGIAKTVTVEIVHDSATNLTDAQVWLEVEYLGTSGFPLSLFATDRAATIIATPVNQAASSVAWTTTGIAVVNKQKLEVTFTPQEIGIIRARVALAKSSYTIYVDPLLTVA